MVGAIGEQAGLCWTFEQDAQRLDATHKTITARSTTGSCCAPYPRPAATSCSAPRTAWETSACGSPCWMSRQPLRSRLPTREQTSARARMTRKHGCRSACRAGPWPQLRARPANVPLGRIAAAVSGLAGDPSHVALDARRGMDYHRLRPQSVPHASPRRGVSQAGDGYITIDLPSPVLDPEAEADQVCQILTDAMEPVRNAMLAIRNDLGRQCGRRACGTTSHQPGQPPRGPAGRHDRGGKHAGRSSGPGNMTAFEPIRE